MFKVFPATLYTGWKIYNLSDVSSIPTRPPLAAVPDARYPPPAWGITEALPAFSLAVPAIMGAPMSSGSAKASHHPS